MWHSDSSRSMVITEGWMRSQVAILTKIHKPNPTAGVRPTHNEPLSLGAAPCLAHGESPWPPWFHSMRWLSWTRWLDPWSHLTTVTPTRIPAAPGNWEIKLRDGGSTWATLFYCGCSARKLQTTTDHLMHNIRENTEDAQKEADGRHKLLGSLLASSPDASQKNAWPRSPERPGTASSRSPSPYISSWAGCSPLLATPRSLRHSSSHLRRPWSASENGLQMALSILRQRIILKMPNLWHYLYFCLIALLKQKELWIIIIIKTPLK